MQLNIPITTQIGGRFKCEVRREDHSVKQVVEFDNLITNIGFNYIQTNNFTATLIYARVGTGNTIPTTSDTNLVSQIASVSYTSFSSTALASSPYTASNTVTFQFGLGAAAGNLSEIGVGWTTTGSTLYSRALIVDGAGNPTTITVLSNEYLYVYYTAYINPPLTDGTGTVVLNGTTYNWTSRAAIAGSVGWAPSVALNGQPGSLTVSNGAIQGITSNISLGSSNNSPALSYITCSASGGVITPILSLPPTQGNVTGGISALSYYVGNTNWQYGFSPAIPKTSSNTLTLNFTHTFTRI
jgi:hypothetical protein